MKKHISLLTGALATLAAFSVAGGGQVTSAQQVVGSAVPGTAVVASSTSKPAKVGSWTPLTNLAPEYLSTCLQIPDGTVMCDAYLSRNWYRLTPDIHGSYVNGTWSAMPLSAESRLYYVSQVLRDGRILFAGGEYGSGGNAAEYFQPATNTWTSLTIPPSLAGVNFYASAGQLPNGNVVNVADFGTRTVIFDIANNTVLTAPNPLGNQDESSWVKLPDDSILTIDLYGTYKDTERFIPSLNKWIPDTPAPVSIWAEALGETGAAHLLPNGKAFFIGGNGKTLIYTPSGSTKPGKWALGPTIPNSLGSTDSPSAMMVNGKILASLGSNANQQAPAFFYEYDYVSNKWTQVDSPTGGPTYNDPTFVMTMLDLPDGSVLFHSFSNQAYVYTPAGKPLEDGRPTIKDVSRNANGSYHVVGTLFNGISQGADYGDDLQPNTNFPIARLTARNGNVYYARTYNWTSTGVQTGNKRVSTEMALPAGLPKGWYSLSIIANGISSDSGDDEGNDDHYSGEGDHWDDDGDTFVIRVR